jgi:hypothetical protein
MSDETNFVPKYSKSYYYDCVKEKIDAVDWGHVASEATEIAATLGGFAYVAAATAASTTFNATVAAVKVARSAIALEGPEPFASLAAATDTSCVPSFIDKNTIERRRQLFSELQSKHPDKVPIVVEKAPGSRINVSPEFLSKRYLVPHTVTLSVFIQSVRSTLKIPPHESIWITTTFGKNVLCNLRVPMVEFYKLYKNNDGFLYLQIREQNVFV